MESTTKSTPFPYTVDDVLRIAGVNSGDITPKPNGRLEIKCRFYSPPIGKKVRKGDGCFSMEHSSGNFNCFNKSCQNAAVCGGCGSKLDFYAFYTGIEGIDGKARRKAANQEIYNVLFRDKKPRNMDRKVHTVPALVIPESDVRLVATRSLEEMSAVYMDMLAMFVLSPYHRRLLRRRGLTDEAIDANGYKTFPQVGLRNVAAILARKHNLLGVPGFYTDKDGVIALVPSGPAFMIPYYTPGGEIAGIQLRYDTPLNRGTKSDGSAKVQRYIWFSSSNKESGASLVTDLCAGYSGFDFKKPPKRVGLTEGKLKGDAAHDLLRQMGKDIPMASIPGISMRTIFRKMLEHLVSIGVVEFIDYFDMDRYQNPNVMKDIEKMYGIMTEYGIRPKFKRWNERFKGIDDCALHAFKMNGGIDIGDD